MTLQRTRKDRFYGRARLLAALAPYLTDESYRKEADSLRRAGFVTGEEHVLLIQQKTTEHEMDQWDLEEYEAKGGYERD